MHVTPRLAAQGSDFTLFAKSVGLVTFRAGSVLLPGRAPSAAKRRRYIDVLPLNGDWGAGYKAKVDAMVAQRNRIRTAMLGYAARHGKK